MKGVETNRKRSWIALSAGLLVLGVGIGLRATVPQASLARLPVVTAGGVVRDEGCLFCHATTRGLTGAHATIGCSSCHLGDGSARTAQTAHVGMELLAGDFTSVSLTCGSGGCHPVETARVVTSLMARAPGIVAVDRFAFGERATPDSDEAELTRAIAPLDRARAGESPAQSHVRQLCSGCHLGARKARPGDLGGEARGGGCTACHLAPPSRRPNDGSGPLHPDVSAAVSEIRCRGCHSRSGRISLSYRGVVELEPNDPRVTRTLPDGRSVGELPGDVHAAAGMTCLDCHTEREVMGDGALHRHAEEGLDVACGDCHIAEPRPQRDADRDDVAARLRAAWGRRGMPAPSEKPLRTHAGTPLWRTNADARTLMLATTGATRSIPAASSHPHHTLRGHKRVSCQACHSAWAPRCPTCHTRFEPATSGDVVAPHDAESGRWVEEAGHNGFGPPLLAVGPSQKIEPFVEGMTLTIEVAGAEAKGRTLWAPLDPHTTAKARSCASCHSPNYAEESYPRAGETTRSTARLLNGDEVARILAVGRCIECHAKYDDPIYQDFTRSQDRLRTHTAPRCKGSRTL